MIVVLSLPLSAILYNIQHVILMLYCCHNDHHNHHYHACRHHCCCFWFCHLFYCCSIIIFSSQSSVLAGYNNHYSPLYTNTSSIPLPFSSKFIQPIHQQHTIQKHKIHIICYINCIATTNQPSDQPSDQPTNNQLSYCYTIVHTNTLSHCRFPVRPVLLLSRFYWLSDNRLSNNQYLLWLQIVDARLVVDRLRSTLYGLMVEHRINFFHPNSIPCLKTSITNLPFPPFHYPLSNTYQLSLTD